MTKVATPIVIDNGTGFCKAGFGGDDGPRALFPNITGRNLISRFIVGEDIKNIFIGNDAQQKRGILKLNSPIKHGIITNWNEMEHVWHYIFSEELNIYPKEHPVLLTEVPFNSKYDRERMAQIMFEEYEVPGLYIALQPVLSLFSSGRTTGMVFESGDGVTNAVPIYEGYALQHAIQRIDIAGRDITKLLKKLLRERGYNLSNKRDGELLRDIKEKFCYIASDYNREIARSSWEEKKEYVLPDHGYLKSEKFSAPEALFQPSLLGLDIDGVDISIHKSITGCDTDIRRDLYGNIVLSGGNTKFPGIGERLTKELTSKTHYSMKVKVVEDPDRNLLAWIGGSILSSLSSFQGMWVTKAEYYEDRFSTIHRKCF